MEVMTKAYKIFVRKPEGKRPRGRPRPRGEDSIGVDLRERRWKYVDWIHLAQDRYQWWALLNTGINFRIRQKAGNLLIS
jgi:hypothetical protein